MKNKITPQQNQSNMQNANKRTNGVNKQYAQNQGDRGKQLNPNQNKNILKIKHYIKSDLFTSNSKFKPCTKVCFNLI